MTTAEPASGVAVRVGRSFALLILGRALSLAAMLGFLVVVTRHLGPADYGAFRTAQAYLSFVYLLANLGLPVVLLREMGFARPDRPQLLAAALGLRLVSALSFFAVAVACVWLLPWEPKVQSAVAVAASGFVALSLFDTLSAVFHVRLRQAGQLYAELSAALLLVAGAAVVAWAGGGVVALAGVLAASQLLQLLVAWRAAARLLPVGLAWERSRWRSLLSAALPLGVANLLIVLYYRADTLLLSLLRPVAEVGIYGVASRLLDTAVGTAILFANLLSPLLAARRHDPLQFRQLFGHGVDAVAVGGGAIALALALFGAEIAALIGGPAFAAAGPAVTILAFTFWLAAFSLLLRGAVTVIDRQAELLPGCLGAVAVACVVYAALIPLAGAPGAALGTLAGEACVVLWTARILARRGLLPQCGARLAATGFAFALAALAGGIGRIWLPWPLALAVAGAAYVAMLAATGVLDRRLLTLLVAVPRIPPTAGDR